MDPLGDRVAKIALFATALFWLAAWGVVGWRTGVAREWLVAYAFALAAYGALGGWSFTPHPGRRMAATGGALALTVVLAWLSFLHLALVGGGLAVALAAAFPVSGGASVLAGSR